VKQKHTLRNVLLVLALILVLFVGGCFALLGAAVNEADKAVKKEQANDRPTTVTEGASFDHDGYTVAKGWSVAPEKFGGGATIKRLRVTLNDDQGTSGRSALFTFRLYRGNDVLSEIGCSSNEMQEGETSLMDCISMNSKKVIGWDTIKVADAF
jgi:hypothetical protein